MTMETKGKPRSPLERAARTVGVLIVCVTGALLVAGVLLFLPPVRAYMVGKALSHADKVLPGDFAAARASWPSIETFEFEDIHWTDGSDSLLSADRIHLSIGLLPLAKKDIRIESLIVEGLSMDVPAIASRFSTNEKSPGPEEKKPGGFPRVGALPAVPSVAADSIRVTASFIRLTETMAVSALKIDAGLDLRRGTSPWVRVDTLEVAGPDTTWKVDGLTLYAAPDRGLVKGEGRGALTPQWPARLSIAPLQRDRFRLVLSSGAFETGGMGGRVGDSVGDGIGLELDIALTRQGVRMESIAFDGVVRTPGTRDLSKDPQIAPRVEGLPDLDGLALSLRGTVGLTEGFSADLSCDIERSNWLDGGGFALEYDGGKLSLEDVTLAMPGLSVTGAMSTGPDSLEAEVDIRVNDARWIKTLSPGTELPEPLSAAVRVSATRASKGSVVRADIAAHGKLGGLSLDGLRVRSDLSLEEKVPSRVLLTAETMGYHVGLVADVLRKPDVEARVAPIRLQEAPIDHSALAFSAREAGTVRYSTGNRGIFVKDVRVTGDFGDLSISAQLDSLRRGPFSLAYSSASPPAILAKLLGLTEEKKRRLARDWAADAPFTLEADGEIASSSPPRVQASVAFRLPGPRHIAILLPDSADVEDLGPLQGTLSLASHTEGESDGYGVNLDLRRTEWIDSSAVRIVTHGGDVAVDTIGVAFEGLEIGVSGTIEQDVFDLAANLAVTDSRWIRRFSAAAPDVALRGGARLRGTRGKPTLEAALEGSVTSNAYKIPEFSATLGLDTTRVQAVLSAPQGVRTEQVRLDRVAARLSSVGGSAGVFPVRLALDAEGEKLALHQSLQVDTVSGIGVEVDTLDLTLGNQDLHATKPFLVRWRSRPEGVSIEDVDLAGTLGTIRLSGLLRPDSSDVDGAVVIALPKEPPPALARPHLWPESIRLDLRARGTSDITANVEVSGFTLVDERRPLLHVEFTSDAEWVEAALSAGDSLGEILKGRGRFPASTRIYPPSLGLRDGPITFNAVLDRLPAVTRLIGPTRAIPPDEIIRISGRADVGGNTGSPIGIVSLSVEFADWPKLSQYRTRIEGGLGSRAGADSMRTPDGAGLSENLKTIWGEENGLAVFVELEREGNPVLTARGLYPLNVSLRPAKAWTSEDARIDLRIESTELPLADFDPLLPLDIGLGGFVTLRIAGSGPLEEFSVDGSVKTKDLEISLAEQARAVAQTELVLSGTSRRPAVKGNIEIVNGLIRVPDAPKSLHAVEGEALLWRDSLSVAGGDTVVAVEAPARSEDSARRAIEPDIDVSIRIPSGLWIRGKGLDIELAGELIVKQKGGKPIVIGELRAIRGNLIFLGRTLDLERGTVTFYGEDEINPSLDVVLRTNIEGNKIQIIFGGTVQKPQVSLESEPDMSETDIMSVLLFGRAFDDLDDDQANLVRRRSAEMIASLGAVKLQEEVGGQLGVDVVTVTSTGKDQEGTALSFGKYLNARTLLSYGYPLDNESRSYVSLEYFLKGQFVIKSTYDNEGVGSLGVGWSKDY